MLRLISLFVLLVPLTVSAQTVIDITSQDGSSVCSYPTNGVSASNTNPGHLTAQLSGTPTGSGCASGSTNNPPTAGFTYSANGLTVTFTDTSTDSDGSIVSHSWTFGDGGTSTAANPSHTYGSANTYSVKETVTDNGGASASKTQSVTISGGGGGGACPTIPSGTTGITNFTRWSGNQTVYYYGNLGGNKTVDVTSFDSVYSTWPGQYGLIAQYSLPVNNYVSMAFHVPVNYTTASNVPNPLYGEYTVGETGASAPITMTISTSCGDFSNPSTHPTSTVVPGCYHSLASPGGILLWRNTNSCVLSSNKTYYLNLINADTSNVTPGGGGTATSSKNSACSSVCTDPVQNGPGTWSGYTPN